MKKHHREIIRAQDRQRAGWEEIDEAAKERPVSTSEQNLNKSRVANGRLDTPKHVAFAAE